MKILFRGSALAALFTISFSLQSYLAVVTSPVADLLHQPMSILKEQYKNGYSYAFMPIHYEMPNMCPRGHQLRANDIVNVVGALNDEVKVQISSFFYLRQNSTIPQQSYWMRKKDLIALDDLPAETPHHVCIPKPIKINEAITEAITLAQPWHDAKTDTLFSAGTRFAASDSDKKRHHIYVFDPSKKQYGISPCPRDLCVQPSSTNLKERRAQMISLVRSWSANKHGFIPYAWGGCSISKKINYPQAQTKILECTNGESITYYEWPGKSESPKTGIDCSGLILLAAQSVGIPYFCKNSYTVETTLRPVTQKEPLEIGDIIWIRGHVMLVADLEKNTLIEARGYEHGYGKVHEIPLSEEFKGITRYDDLIAAYENNQPIERFDKYGNIVSTIQIKLFKLA